MIILYTPIEYVCPVRKYGNKVPEGINVALELFTLSGSGDHTNEITSNPVEEGIDITDNARRLPIRKSYEVLIPDDPGRYLFAGEQAAVTAERFSQIVWEFLLRLKNEFVLLELSAKDGYYQNMMIESMRPSETIETGNTMQFTIDFKEVRIARSMAGIYYEPTNENVAKQLAEKKPNGRGTVQDVDETKPENSNDTALARQYASRLGTQ